LLKELWQASWLQLTSRWTGPRLALAEPNGEDPGTEARVKL
jgi:hypothetical protein